MRFLLKYPGVHSVIQLKYFQSIDLTVYSLFIPSGLVFMSNTQALKYRSVTDIVRPIRGIVRRREETTGHSVRPK